MGTKAPSHLRHTSKDFSYTLHRSLRNKSGVMLQPDTLFQLLALVQVLSKLRFPLPPSIEHRSNISRTSTKDFLRSNFDRTSVELRQRDIPSIPSLMHSYASYTCSIFYFRFARTLDYLTDVTSRNSKNGDDPTSSSDMPIHVAVAFLLRYSNRNTFCTSLFLFR